MHSELVLDVPYPRERLRDVLTGNTWKLGSHLKDIDSVVLDEVCERNSGNIVATHTWRAKDSVPARLSRYINSDKIVWTATVEWSRKDFTSRWRLEPHAVVLPLIFHANMEMLEFQEGESSRLCIVFKIDGLGNSRWIRLIANEIASNSIMKLIAALECLILLEEA